MKGDVHQLKPGQMGVVAHTLNKFSRNGLVARTTPGVYDFFYYDTKGEKQPVIPAYHVPHGVMVLIVGKFNLFAIGHEDRPKIYYKIIWNDLVCFIEQNDIINPRACDNDNAI